MSADPGATFFRRLTSWFMTWPLIFADANPGAPPTQGKTTPWKIVAVREPAVTGRGRACRLQKKSRPLGLPESYLEPSVNVQNGGSTRASAALAV
jgi:hypothetical protein